jgi:hypothetical protein
MLVKLRPVLDDCERPRLCVRRRDWLRRLPADRDRAGRPRRFDLAFVLVLAMTPLRFNLG